jgi:hypothetical protein
MDIDRSEVVGTIKVTDSSGVVIGKPSGPLKWHEWHDYCAVALSLHPEAKCHITVTGKSQG